LAQDIWLQASPIQRREGRAARPAMAPFLTLLAATWALAGAFEAPNMTEWTAAKKAEEDAAAAAAAKESKMAAVNKVVSMIESLRTQVMQEGEAEAGTYNKFSCFCKDTSTEKSAAITKGQDAQTSLTATIGQLSSRRIELDASVKKLLGEIKDAEDEMKTAEAARAKTLEEYRKNEVDLAGAIEALHGAIDALKASKMAPTLAQLRAVTESAKGAALLAEALGLGAKRKGLTLLLQDAPEVQTENYSFKSDSILSTLEGLLTDFKAEKIKIDAAEVKSITDHDIFMQERTNFVKGKNLELDSAREEKAQKQEEIASNSQQLSTVSAVLLDDQEYLKELSGMCGDKARTWDQRTQARQDELQALTAAIGILKGTVDEKTTAATIRFAQRGTSVRLANMVATNENAMEALEAEAEGAETAGPASFLQRRLRKRITPAGAVASAAAVEEEGRRSVVALLRQRGEQLHSATLVSLAGQLSGDAFGKVKQLIQELIERLLKEQENEATQKGWCDKSTSAAKQKRDYAAEAIAELNGRMAELEALRAQLTESLTVLGEEIKALKDEQIEAVAIRAAEKAQNGKTVDEAKAGLSAVQEAIQILDRFYKTQAKAVVDLSLSQRGPAADEAADAGFDAGEAYKGAQSAAGGVIGMLEVISGDFTRTVTETLKVEAQAEQDHLAFMTESGKSQAEKEAAELERKRQFDDTEEKLSSDTDSLKSETETLQGSLKELMQLHEACAKGMSYDDRVARREEEIDALKKALCILGSFARYGPDGPAAARDC